MTNACNLDCPICFTYNRPDRRYHMSREELRPLLDKLIARAGPFDLINVTGGADMSLLEVNEALYGLFAWQAGTYRFEPGDVEYYPQSVTPRSPTTVA